MKQLIFVFLISVPFVAHAEFNSLEIVEDSSIQYEVDESLIEKEEESIYEINEDIEENESEWGYDSLTFLEE